MRGRSLCINEDGKPPPFFFLCPLEYALEQSGVIACST